MATSGDQVKIFQCSKCQNDLDMSSKTLSCLHSLCDRCLDEEFHGEKTGVANCPECQELFKIEQLTLSSFLLNSLKRQRLESSELKCDVCFREGKDSLAKIWCKDCDTFFCDTCNRVHTILPREKHHSIKLDENGKDEIQKFMGTVLCNIHKKDEECYCDKCNTCFCDTCYKNHLNQSPHCPSHPISVREEAVKKRTSEGPTLLKEIEHLKNNLQERTRKSQIYCEQLEIDFQSKCKEIWQNYEVVLQEMRERMIVMCEELRSLKDEQVKKWQESAEENEKLVKKLEIWWLNLCHLLEKDEKNKNEMICGVQLVGSKFALSSIHLPHQPIRKVELRVKFSDLFLKFLEKVKNEEIASGSLINSDNLILFETEWNLPETNTDRSIYSIVVSKKDNHIFVADFPNKSVMEFSEFGELISEFILIDKGKEFFPREMVLSSSEILWVNCGGMNFGQEEKIFLLERRNVYPFLKIKIIIDKKKQNFPDSFSICNFKKTILVCNQKKFQIDFYTENGEYKKTIDTGESGGNWPLIRADPSTGNFWGALQNTCKIYCFDENGQNIETFETKENISNFYINEFGNLYCCNWEGIFSFVTEKTLHKFKKRCAHNPRIFVSNEKIFVCSKIDGKVLIKIFKILD